jgi:hypothetical protein
MPEHTITGLVVFSDGTPAAETIVDIYDSEYLDFFAGPSSETDEHGRFTIKCIKGRRYQILASTEGNESDSIEYDASSDARPIVLVLSRRKLSKDDLFK